MGRGHAVAQLIEALRSKSEGSRFRFLMVSLEFFIDIRTMDLGLTQPLTEMSTRNIFWPLRRADFLEIWEPQLRTQFL